MDKLQELTEKLYNEGLSKGKEEGEKMIAEATAKAGGIIADAKAEAAKIIAEAEAKAADIITKTESDVRMAACQSLQATKKDIEELIIGKISSKPVSDTLQDAGFLKDIIQSVASSFSASESKDISLLLPESLKEKLEPWVNGELCKALGTEVKAEFSKKIAGGFNIGPKDGSWFVSLTDDTFKELIAEYLRPVTRKLLFGE